MIEPEIFGISAKDILYNDLDDFMSKVLTTYFKKIMAIRNDPKVYCFNYAIGIEKIIKEVNAICDIFPGKELMQKISERCLYHSKKPFEIFREELTISAVPMALETALDLYNQLAGKTILA